MNLIKGFKVDAQQVLIELKEAIVDIVESIPGKNFTGTSVAKQLNINRTLTWKLLKFIESDDVFLGSQFIPGEPSFRNFVLSTKRIGISPQLINRAIDSHNEYLKLMTKYAGDRESLDLMLMALSPEGRNIAYQDQKKNLYRNQRFIIGMSASVQFYTMIMRKLEPDASLIGMILLKGYKNILRYSLTPPYRMFSPVLYKTSRTSKDAFSASPIPFAIEQPADAIIPYYPEFCTCSLYQPEDSEREVNLDDILPDQMNMDSELNFVTAVDIKTRTDSADQERDEEGYATTMISCETNIPLERIIVDVFLERASNYITPEVKVFNLLGMNETNKWTIYNMPDIHRLPNDENLSYLGKGISRAAIKDMKWYMDMLSDSFRRLGERAENYDLYRVEIPFPYLPSSTLFTYKYRID